MPLQAQKTSDGRIVFVVEADDSKIDSGLKSVTRKIKAESANWGQHVKDYFGKEMDNILDKVAELGKAFGKFLVDFAVQGVELAENLKEVDGMVEQTFGQAGQKKMTSWAKDAAKQFGMAEMQAKKYATTLGLVAKSQGATTDEAEDMGEKLAGLAVDFGAAYQMDSDTALTKIRSALTGSGTALKGYVDMSAKAMNEYAQAQGYKNYSSMTAEQQFKLRYQRLMEWANEGSDPIMGSFARSKGTVGNAQARAQAGVQNIETEFGTALLPYKEKFYTGIANLVELLSHAPPALEGDLEHLQQWSSEIQSAADERRKELDEVALAQGRKVIDADMEGTEYDPTLHKSFGEALYTQLQSMQQDAGGRQREKIDAALAALKPYITDIDAAEAKLREYQEQIDYLTSGDPAAAEQAGADVAGAVADGIASQQPAVTAAVNGIIKEIDRLNRRGPIYKGSFYMPHASGLDYVPYDNYRASLHAGESVLTAAEAKLWRSMKYGIQPSGLNYDALGSTMRENIRGGGNVYLDGQAVGRVISARQADAYRALERSGFQQ